MQNIFFEWCISFLHFLSVFATTAVKRQTTRKASGQMVSFWIVQCCVDLNCEEFKYCAELENFSFLAIFQIEPVRGSNINVYLQVRGSQW